MSKVDITERSKELFLAYAKDACNWNGFPIVGGNVDNSKEDRGNLTQLKIAGLVKTIKDEVLFLEFTELGKKYAKEIGVDLDWISD